MKELRVIERDNIWCVEHLVGGKPDPEIVDLFDGEHVLPTPFMTTLPVTTVIDELGRRNPDCLITCLDFVRIEAEGMDQMVPVDSEAPLVHFKVEEGTDRPHVAHCGVPLEVDTPSTYIPANVTCPDCRARGGYNWALPIAIRNEARRFA